MTEQAIQHAKPRVPTPIPEYCLRFSASARNVRWLLREAETGTHSEDLRQKLRHLSIAMTLPNMYTILELVSVGQLITLVSNIVFHISAYGAEPQRPAEVQKRAEIRAKFLQHVSTFDAREGFNASFTDFEGDPLSMLEPMPPLCTHLEQLATLISDRFLLFFMWSTKRSAAARNMPRAFWVGFAAARILRRAEALANSPQPFQSTQVYSPRANLLHFIGNLLPEFRSDPHLATRNPLWKHSVTEGYIHADDFKVNIDVLLHCYRLHILAEPIRRRLRPFAKVTHRRAKAHRGCVASVLNAELVDSIVEIAFLLISAEELPTY